MTHRQSCPDHPQYKRGCEACRVQAREYERARRARQRALQPVPPAATDANASVGSEVQVGPAVAAVQASLATLGDLTGHEWAAAAAIAMARILDHPGAVTTQPSAAKQLAATMEMLRREAEPKRGRLTAVQKLSTRPDAG